MFGQALGAIGEMVVKVIPDTSGFGAQVNSELARQGSSVNAAAAGAGSQMGRKVGIGIAAGVAGAFGKGVIDFTSFERSMNEIFTLLPGLSQQAYDEISDQTKAFSAETGTSLDQTIGGLYDALGAGVPKENVFAFLETANELAKGGAVDLTLAVDALTTGVNAFGLGAEGAGRVSDAVFKSVALGKSTVDEIANSLFQVAPIAAQFGVSVEDVAAGYAVLTSKGVPAAQSATQMAAALAELGKDGTKASGIFEELAGKSFQQFIDEGGNMVEAAILMGEGADELGLSVLDMFGSIEGGKAFANLAADADLSRDFLAQVQDSAGATEAAFVQMEKGIGPALDKAKARIDVALVNLGDTLAPVVETVGLALAGFLGVLAELPGPLVAVGLGALGFAGGLLAIAGPALKAIALVGQIGKAVSAMSALLAANPFVLLALAVAGLAFIIYKNWDTIKETIGEALDWITDKIEVFVGWVQEIFGIFFRGDFTGISGWAEDSKIVDVLFDIRETIVGWVDAVTGAFTKAQRAVGRSIDAIAGALTKLAGIFRKAWDVVFAIVSTVLSVMYDFTATWIGRFQALFTNLFTWFTAAWQVATGVVLGIVQTFTAAITTIVGAFIAVFQAIWLAFWNGVTLVVQTAVTAITFVLQPLIAMFQVVIPFALSVLQSATAIAWGVVQGVVQVAWGVISPILDAIRGALDNVGGAMETLGSVAGSVFDTIKGTIDSAVSFAIARINDLKNAISNALGPIGSFLGAAGRVAGAGVSGLGNLIGFDTGGVVPGPLGAPRLILAHGGETILPTHKYPLTSSDALAGSQGAQRGEIAVAVNLNGPVTIATPYDVVELGRDLGREAARELRAQGELS